MAVKNENGEGNPPHVVFLPYFITSHLVPLVDAARVFAAHGVKVSIITTPVNARIFQSSVDKDIESGLQISVHILKFPSAQVGLPEGVENFQVATTKELQGKVFYAIQMLQKPMEDLIIDLNPDSIFSDMFFYWSVDLAQRLKIPSFVFHATNFVWPSIVHSLKIHRPFENEKSESESFLIPGLPDKIEMKSSQLPDYDKTITGWGAVLDKIRESELRSHGIVHDSFYELEPAYVEHCKKIGGDKYWHIGPLFHFSKRDKSDADSTEKHSCVAWLDSQNPDSVLYICFGSLVRFSETQVIEMASALEVCDCPFIWVVKKEQESWLPTGFQERISKTSKGVIIVGWAPQLSILSHPAVGGFMTHCGWNSLLEALTYGVPLVTWPVFAEQFYNEKLVEILGVGLRVGSEIWSLQNLDIVSHLIERSKIEAAVNGLMCDSEESREIRRKAKEVSAMGQKAVQEGESSHRNLMALIEEIKNY